MKRINKEEFLKLKDEIEFYYYSLGDKFIYVSKLKYNHERLCYSNDDKFVETETSKENQVFNPYLPNTEYIPDGEPRIFNNRLYVYGSHDRFGASWFCERPYVLYSAPIDDLSDFTYHGVIVPNEIDDRLGNLYAPDCIKGVDGRYYVYYSKADTSITSVAVCDTPNGPFTYYGDVIYPDKTPLGLKEDDYFQFDPSVLVDDDNRVYLYSGSGQYDKQHRVKSKMVGCICYELESDMITLKDNGNILLKGNNTRDTKDFFEGASIRKIDGLYYLVYPVLDGSGLHVAVSKYPNKDFKLVGPIHSTSDIGLNGHTLDNPSFQKGNNHGGLAKINDDWFIFDHRRTDNSGFSRQGIAELTKFENGTFKHVETTSQGLNKYPLKGIGFYPSHIACNIIGDSYITENKKDLLAYTNSCVKIIDEALIGYKYFSFKNLKKVTLEFEGTNQDIKVAIRFGEYEKDYQIKDVYINGTQNISFEIDNITSEQLPLFIKVYKTNKSNSEGIEVLLNQIYFE